MKRDLLEYARKLAKGARRKLAEDRKQLQEICVTKADANNIAATGSR